MNELEALLHLINIPYLGSVKIRLLIEHYGSANSAVAADLKEIAEFPGFGPKVIESMQKCLGNNFAQKELALAKSYGVTLIPYTSEQYPKRLREIPDYPFILYVKGEIKDCDSRSIAIIGTRRKSIYGGEMAEKFAKELTGYGFTIVSGLARGIDTTAHISALNNGRTLAVIGSGLADIYPQENLALADAICKKGALISEFSMRTPPNRHNFPQRNRIVSGMTMGTLLIEAPLKSGAMITMEQGLAQGRKLFAVPGRADSENFQGNHDLIKKGYANLVENGQDIVESYQDLFHHLKKNSSKPQIKAKLEIEEEAFLARLPYHELQFDEIANLTQLPVMKVNVLMMSLVLKQALKEFPGKIYKKV